MNLTEEQRKQFSDKFQEVLEYRLGLRLMAEVADKLGESREELSSRVDSMDQEAIDNLIKSNFADSEIEKFAEEESQKILSELAKDVQ